MLLKFVVGIQKLKYFAVSEVFEFRNRLSK